MVTTAMADSFIWARALFTALTGPTQLFFTPFGAKPGARTRPHRRRLTGGTEWSVHSVLFEQPWPFESIGCLKALLE
jgi:hypothetical protein